MKNEERDDLFENGIIVPVYYSDTDGKRIIDIEGMRASFEEQLKIVLDED